MGRLFLEVHIERGREDLIPTLISVVDLDDMGDIHDIPNFDTSKYGWLDQYVNPDLQFEDG